jgi:hypothetical protein
MRRVLGLIALTVIIGWLTSVFAPSLVGTASQRRLPPRFQD